MNAARSMIGLIVGVGMLLASYAAEQERRDGSEVEVVLGVGDGLPDQLRSGRSYDATLTVEWTGALSGRDSLVSVYVSRRDGGVEADTDERWPLVCASAYDDVIGAVRIRCPFEAPSPGDFALLLEVVGDEGDVIGEALYAHEITP